MKLNIELLTEVERKLLIEEIEKECSIEGITLTPISDKMINILHAKVHAKVVNYLVSLYLSAKCDGYKPMYFSSLFEGILDNLDIEVSIEDCHLLPTLCEELHILYLNSSYSYTNGKLVRKKSKSNLLELGAVYTQDNIAHIIVFRTISNLHIDNHSSLRILDFATGTGRFYRKIVECLSVLHGITPDKSITENIYAVDIDPTAINICRLNAISLLDTKTIENASIVTKHIVLKNGLIKENLFSDKNAIKKSDLDGLFYNGFDAVVSNPPYLVLKANKNKMDEATVESINNMAKYFRSSNDYKYSIEGMLNLYQLSLEAIIGMLKPLGEMGIICPSTLFADISASKLRKYFLSKNKVSYIKYFSEDDPLFDNITQATCIFHLTKGGCTDNIEIEYCGKDYNISFEDVKQIFSKNWEIPSIEKIEWDILRKLISIPCLRKRSQIRNKRGELDLSLFKDYITDQTTKYRLVRGNMISVDGLKDINHEFVVEDFLKNKSDAYIKNDFNKKRLICQQISNQTQKVRLKFVVCERHDILGNSCNYISVDENLIEAVSALLNSALLNWRFKITSTNNHINNYELDDLPIIDIESIGETVINLDGVERDEEVCRLYGLNKDETKYILSQYYDII